MIVAPIIHTRTFSCDFNSEFLVRPDSFMDSDIKWARKKVLGATNAIDGLQGVRWLIADNEKYRMAGVVGFLKDICGNCQLSVEDKRKSEELFYDDKGRAVYAFIGIVIHKRKSKEYGVIDCDYLWKLYLEKIYTIWKRTYQEVVVENFADIKFASRTANIEINSETIGTQELYETNSITDYELFTGLLCDRIRNDFSFCSNLQDYNSIKQSEFAIVTTSPNNIVRIKREKGITSEVAVKQPLQSAITDEQNMQFETPENKKKVLLVIAVLMIGLMILFIIIPMLS